MTDRRADIPQGLIQPSTSRASAFRGSMPTDEAGKSTTTRRQKRQEVGA